MKLEQLRYLQEAVKYNSISIAAEKNFISQPSFSAAITKLEKELGVTLLRRNSKGVTATEVGNVILERSRDIFMAIDDIKESAITHCNAGIINISAIPCISDKVLPIALKKLKSQQALFSLSVSTAESHNILHNVASGISTLGILFYHDNIEQTEVKFTPLFDDQYVLYVGEHSPLWQRNQITLDEALSQPYIAYGEEFIKDNGSWTRSLGADKSPKIVFRTDELESIKRMVSQDNYVAFFPKFMSQDDIYLKYGLIRALPIQDFQLTVQVGYIESTKYKISNIEKIFLHTLKQVVEEVFSQ